MSEIYEGQQYASRESIDWEASFERMRAERDELAAEVTELTEEIERLQRESDM